MTFTWALDTLLGNIFFAVIVVEGRCNYSEEP